MKIISVTLLIAVLLFGCNNKELNRYSYAVEPVDQEIARYNNADDWRYSTEMNGEDMIEPYHEHDKFSLAYPNITSIDQYEPEIQSREDYEYIPENEFLSPARHPTSTFSIDVDTASYSKIRDFLDKNRLPVTDAVRIEEMLNYFDYDYPQPKDHHPFSVTTELSDAPWQCKHQLLHIGIKGKNINREKLPPSNLVFLIDVSGSMNEELPLVKSAFNILLKQLGEQDRISIVVYAGAAGVVLPPTKGTDKSIIHQAIDKLKAGGSTAGGQGIKLAYQLAKQSFIKNGNNRVILATDGDFNVGISSEADLIHLIEEKRQEDIFLSVIGFGSDNFQDRKMETLADKGNGNYAYIDNIKEANKVFNQQLTGTLFTIAKDVKLQLEFNPLKVKSYRLIGYKNRLLEHQDFDNDLKDAGELGVGHSVTALYEIVPNKGDVEKSSLKYQTQQLSKLAEHSNELVTIKLRYKKPDEQTSQLVEHIVQADGILLDQTSDNFRFSAAVTEFGMLLQQSKYRGNANYQQLLSLAKQAKTKDENGYRAEFIRLVETAQLLTEQKDNTQFK